MRLLILSSAYRTDISLSRSHYLYLYGSQMPIQICWNFLPLLAQWLYLFKSNKKEISTVLEVIFFWHLKGCLNTLKSIFMAIFIGGCKLRCGGRASLRPTSTPGRHLPLPCCLVTNASTEGHASVQYPRKRSSVTWQSHSQQCSGHYRAGCWLQRLAPLTVRERGLLPFCRWDAC